MTRPNKHQYFLSIAKVASSRGTCGRRQVGCVLVDFNDQVLATGFNGVPSKMEHCTDKPCPGMSFKSGEGLEACRATHAEINALIQCKEPHQIKTVYTTVSPCISCVKAIMNTSAQQIVFTEEYSHPESKILWESVKGTTIYGSHGMLATMSTTWCQIKDEV